MAQSKSKKHCGKCGDRGHSIRTCTQMKAVSAARAKEVSAYGKLEAATRNKLPSSAFGLPKQRKYPMEDRGHQIAAEQQATEMQRKGKLTPAHASRIRAKAKRLPGE